nr:hypothetical protein T03D3.9 - Caenorhabditis elegans [Caenorhabditis elegans]
MIDDWIYIYLPSTFCALAFLVNPIFISLIFSEKSVIFGNYRYLFLYFAVFNMIYSIMNVLVQLIAIKYGWFQTSSSEFNYHMLTARCSFIGSSYAVLLSHFIYRYLVILNSSLTRHHFPWYMTGSFLLIVVYYSLSYATCYFPGKANLEVLQYIRVDFQENFGIDSRNLNIMGSMFSVGSDTTTLRAWKTIISLSTISIASITSFFVMARLIMQELKTMSVRTSQKTSRLQFELLRALIVQTVIPIFISFSPCLLCWYSPIFGIQLHKSFNYLETIALGVFSFVDPIAIILCLPIFRGRVLNAVSCNTKTNPENQADNNSQRQPPVSSNTLLNAYFQRNTIFFHK